MMTIGHSTLSIEAFLQALTENGVETVVDVRRFPGSRRHPQFGQGALFASLKNMGIRGINRGEGLGGRRRSLADSVNTGWRNESFRGYADYMQTEAFAREIDWLVSLPEIDKTVVMCAEALPWRCHRSLIADAVLARGMAVEDIFVKADGESELRQHKMTDFAQVRDGRVWYPKAPELFV
ncbi:DUF488 domain-containing protein [Edaphobacter albus]|uniref:DUF488 domain-containing protein n=1 Tax=Edaphobacter sp. 4G125 TaxID=2763071 RepID=UPI001645805E|nr:DUF488 domain-containing protein [Edaphobacter sp. 4G125]QNI36071.1 DUF488 domain-containing protein [Edaphobacter sp. 4G125]